MGQRTDGHSHSNLDCESRVPSDAKVEVSKGLNELKCNGALLNQCHITSSLTDTFGGYRERVNPCVVKTQTLKRTATTYLSIIIQALEELVTQRTVSVLALHMIIHIL
jgi:hypothetical protein